MNNGDLLGLNLNNAGCDGRPLPYVLEKQTRKVIAFTFGPRSDATFKKLLGLFDQCKIDRIDTDDWGAYNRV